MGQLARLKTRDWKEKRERGREDKGRGTSCEMIDETRAGTRTLDETRREKTLRGHEDAMPGTLRPGLTRGNESEGGRGRKESSRVRGTSAFRGRASLR